MYIQTIYILFYGAKCHKILNNLYNPKKKLIIPSSGNLVSEIFFVGDCEELRGSLFFRRFKMSENGILWGFIASIKTWLWNQLLKSFDKTKSGCKRKKFIKNLHFIFQDVNHTTDLFLKVFGRLAKRDINKIESLFLS